MSIGYACITIGINENLKGCILKNATEDNLNQIIKHNLEVLDKQIQYNIDNNIRLFRISSDIIPFGSHQVNTIKWWDTYKERLLEIGEKIKKANMRVSMHPGQYTVLNSPNEEVVKKSIQDIEYHTKFLDSLNVDTSCKVVLHIGGLYKNKKEAIDRFKQNYKFISDIAKRRLVIENDEKSFNIQDVLEIGTQVNIPVVFDNLHHNINKVCDEKTDSYWIDQAKATWKKYDGKQKIHYSQQKIGGKIGSHSDTIEVVKFVEYYKNINGNNLDIMLEVKDKDLSCIKCMHCTQNIKVSELERQWAKYKYSVLEKKASIYSDIRNLLKDKKNVDPIQFYIKIQEALDIESNKRQAYNSLLHVWGYFKDKALDSEKTKFFLYLINIMKEKKV
ncbi:UV-damage endonuclease [Alkalithermobacter thermoalcaliphilus JW-YL-7 = DSM 7308]|uniref:UV-damage endonuclease n=1 Tax=Alkalithermobacter thermoalcaliphilus JW-YL-7 = DSM 7308 TaxID=1121328 RepID=A0A150FNP0_CLOPD|nr:UV-endonuclease UvdE [[Clostridium] paradoxum JW-YL-7 = DSM 7308]SHK86323.1 UV-damage endonuclease [[Clostridium] paradoxum JW-YL-7 = DSM 7308]